MLSAICRSKGGNLMSLYPEQEKKNEAGLEVDKLARRFMAEHNISDYQRAVRYVLIDNPELERQYSGDDEPVDREYIKKSKPAAAEVDRLTQLKMLKHNLSYSQAQVLVFNDPDHADLCKRYIQESRMRVLD